MSYYYHCSLLLLPIVIFVRNTLNCFRRELARIESLFMCLFCCKQNGKNFKWCDIQTVFTHNSNKLEPVRNPSRNFITIYSFGVNYKYLLYCSNIVCQNKKNKKNKTTSFLEFSKLKLNTK